MPLQRYRGYRITRDSLGWLAIRGGHVVYESTYTQLLQRIDTITQKKKEH